MEKDMTTGELFERLFIATSIKDILDNEVIPQPPLFHEYLRQLCLDRGEMREHVIKRSGINRTYGHQLFNGTRKPSRDKVIQIAFGFGLNIEETQQLLKAAQESPLTPKLKRDATILYCIMHQLDYSEAQKLLVSFDMAALGS